MQQYCSHSECLKTDNMSRASDKQEAPETYRQTGLDLNKHGDGGVFKCVYEERPTGNALTLSPFTQPQRQMPLKTPDICQQYSSNTTYCIRNLPQTDWFD